MTVYKKHIKYNSIGGSKIKEKGKYVSYKQQKKAEAAVSIYKVDFKANFQKQR